MGTAQQLNGQHPLLFYAPVETGLRGRPQIVRFDRVDNHGINAVQAWATAAIAPESLVLSDGWPGFTRLSALVPCHEPHITGHGPKAAKHPEFHWVNTLLSNLKTALAGTFHAFAFEKYGHRYLAVKHEQEAYRIKDLADHPHASGRCPTVTFCSERKGMPCHAPKWLWSRRFPQ